MKDFIYLTIITLIVLYVCIHLFMDEVKTDPYPAEFTFIWNDDEESIPPDNSYIFLEFTKGDTIYIGPVDKHFKACQDTIDINDLNIIE